MFGIRTRRPPPFGGIHINDDKDIQIHRPERSFAHSLWAEGRLLLRDLVFALMIAALVVVFIVQPVKVEGTSMLPRLHDGERIFVNKLIYYDEYRWAPKVERGDIVVFWFPDDPSKSYIKRVIGLPGDTVEMREGHRARQWQRSRRKLSRSEVELVAQESGAGLREAELLLRDGRQSRQFQRLAIWGLVPKKYIYGKALFRYWPLSAASVIHHEDLAPMPPAARLSTRPQEMPNTPE